MVVLPRTVVIGGNAPDGSGVPLMRNPDLAPSLPWRRKLGSTGRLPEERTDEEQTVDHDGCRRAACGDSVRSRTKPEPERRTGRRPGSDATRARPAAPGSDEEGARQAGDHRPGPEGGHGPEGARQGRLQGKGQAAGPARAGQAAGHDRTEPAERSAAVSAAPAGRTQAERTQAERAQAGSAG